MKKEQIIALEKEIDDKVPYEERDSKNTLFKALQILSKYSDDIESNAEHDFFYFGIDNYEEISEEDITKMFYLRAIGWNEEYECFYYIM